MLMTISNMSTLKAHLQETYSEVIICLTDKIKHGEALLHFNSHHLEKKKKITSKLPKKSVYRF